MNITKNIYKIARTLVVTVAAFAIGFIALLYLLISIPKVQDTIRATGEKELSKLLQTDVTIGRVSIKPFNEVLLYDVNIPDRDGNDIASIECLGTGLSIFQLIKNHRLVFTYAEIIGLSANINRPDKQSPLNIQFIIDALSSKEPDKEPAPFDIQIYNVVIRRTNLQYHVLSEPQPAKHTLCANHLAINNLRADISLPRLKNDDFLIDIKRLSFEEQSGLVVSNVSTSAHISQEELALNQLRVEMPNSLLALEDFSLKINGLNTIQDSIATIPFRLTTKECYISPADLICFAPALGSLKNRYDISTDIEGPINNLNLHRLLISSYRNELKINLAGQISNILNKENLNFSLPSADIYASATEISSITSALPSLSAKAKEIIRNCGNIHFVGSSKGSLNQINLKSAITTSIGEILIDGDYINRKSRNFVGTIKTPQFSLGRILANNKLGNLAADINIDAQINNKDISGSIVGEIPFIEFNNYQYQNISANITSSTELHDAWLAIDDPNCKFEATASYSALSADTTHISAYVIASDINLKALNFIKQNDDKNLSFYLNSNFSIINKSEINGFADIQNVRFVNNENSGLHISGLRIDAQPSDDHQSIKIDSDFFKGSLIGTYNINHLAHAATNMVGDVLPSLIGQKQEVQSHDIYNDFTYYFTILPNEELHNLLHLPIKIIDNVIISGFFNESTSGFSADIVAPYLLNGNKLIEGTRLHAGLDSIGKNITMEAATIIPLKKGKTAIQLNANAVNDRLDTNLGWKVDTPRDYSGNLNLSTQFVRNTDNQLLSNININPTRLIFNDTVWQVHPAIVNVNNKIIDIHNMRGSCDQQYININGTISPDPDDILQLDLNKISLDYVFEALSIDNVMFGGIATGQFNASELLSGFPKLSTPCLHVDGLAYNNAVLGNADIVSQWKNEEKAITITADIDQFNGRKSAVDGAIYPTMDSLYFDFDCDKVNVAFMKPFMAAFTSHVEGLASGHATLFGTFHDLDMKGDIFAEDLCLKIDFTNCYYYATDSIHVTPGHISLDNIKLRDQFGNTANLNGYIDHTCFHLPKFQFRVTDTQNLLCYNLPQTPDFNWYGTIYGNGSAIVTGEPGSVDITVRMTTAPKSIFTFILSDAETVSDYKFVTYVDRNRDQKKDTVSLIPQAVLDIIAQNAQSEEAASTYKIDLQADVTPEAQLILVMDPIGGDKIRANGSGNVRMVYNSTDESLNMYGKYTLEKGNYNFTLQDVFIKDFTIRQGSNISFDGDPFAAKLDINAIYSLNANIQDLDESFANDRELQRTNVPVYAVLKAKGDIREPDIAFDLEFPTLSSDAYRKVKSIISTEDMMNRQIIYLLALNRFYTPDYMGGTNRNNELTSVASSTFSSQLHNILGQISENWDIAPNFRSDKGDFSDVQVDVALSSQLLNNRLIFNGNFGYRNNSLNTRNTNFIGDFDIEYLLNRQGTIRLKAYNHFNDQSYYVKNSLTTQGVGVEFKFDFNNPFRKNIILPKSLINTNSLPTDSVTIESSEVNPKIIETQNSTITK